jgi:hypothetical protein
MDKDSHRFPTLHGKSDTVLIGKGCGGIAIPVLRILVFVGILFISVFSHYRKFAYLRQAEREKPVLMILGFPFSSLNACTISFPFPDS